MNFSRLIIMFYVVVCLTCIRVALVIFQSLLILRCSVEMKIRISYFRKFKKLYFHKIKNVIWFISCTFEGAYNIHTLVSINYPELTKITITLTWDCENASGLILRLHHQTCFFPCLKYYIHFYRMSIRCLSLMCSC